MDRVRHWLGKHVLLAKSFGCDGEKPLVIRTHHAHVNVVVPRNEAIVASGAQCRTRIEKVRNIVFAAHAINLF